MSNRYKPIRRLATGGMGDVFLSRELGIDGSTARRVALKRIRPELARDEHFRELFRREARVAIRMSHPNIVHVYEVGMNGDDLFLTMEYVEGRTLHELLHQASRMRYEIPIEVTMAIGLDVSRGLSYAHELRDEAGLALEIVHRDLSPKNVLVSLDGDAKILDFGVAKARIALDESEQFELKGNPAYLSPEQARLESVDRRSDIFTLGILLWEMTTGRKLYQVSNPMQAMEVIGKVPVPPATNYRRTPPGWEGVLRRALAADRDQRYGSARELQLDIEEVARSAGARVSNLPVVATLAALFPEVALDVDTTTPGARRPTVLVVDDEPHMLDLLTRTLRRGFEVRTAPSVAEALAILDQVPCDAVLSDERMPSGRGMDLLSHVARESPRTVRIMITAHAETDLMLQAINDGRVDRFVVKPFQPAELLSIVEQTLGDRRPLATAESPFGHEPTSRSGLAQFADPETVVDLRRHISPMVSIPWESLNHLARPTRDQALSAVLMVGVADQAMAHDELGAADWALSTRLAHYWVHGEGQAIVAILPGIGADLAVTLIGELRAAVSGALGTQVAFAMAELGQSIDLVEIGRQVEEAAVAAWQQENTA